MFQSFDKPPKMNSYLKKPLFYAITITLCCVLYVNTRARAISQAKTHSRKRNKLRKQRGNPRSDMCILFDGCSSIYAKSKNNRLDVERSTYVGCFYCGQIFHAESITTFSADNTALCAICGNYSLLPSFTQNLSLDLLDQMHKIYYSGK